MQAPTQAHAPLGAVDAGCAMTADYFSYIFVASMIAAVVSRHGVAPPSAEFPEMVISLCPVTEMAIFLCLQPKPGKKVRG
eukprot:1157334-Pelagomonas_calceolata.AAC.12